MEGFSPALTSGIQNLLQSDDTSVRTAAYETCLSEPIEPLMIERLTPQERLVIPSSLQWSDVGNWSTLLEFLTEKKNLSVITDHPTLDFGSDNILIKNNPDASGKKIITLGLKDVVIIDTPDVLLIADQSKANSEMKNLIEKIKSEYPKLL
jgi:mannose-1-phosphate guanylyltransferase